MSESKTILIVDDDPFARDMFAMIIESGDYETLTAGDGKEGLLIFSEHPEIALVVTDKNMPELDGIGLIKEIRKSGATVPILLLTGNDEGAEGLAAGASAAVLKDEDIQDKILEEVAKLIG